MLGLRSRRAPAHHTTRSTRTTTTTRRRFTLHRKSPTRQAAGYKAALSNPNTTHHGRTHAKRSLRHMGQGHAAHVPLTTRIKRFLGVRSRPRRTTHHTTRTTRI